MRADWIALDWGTSHLRIWAMPDSGGDSGGGGSANPLAHRASSQGMAGVSQDEFEPVLLGLMDDWLWDSADGDSLGDSLCVVGCGMVGARQGWQEVPYATALTGESVAVKTRANLRIHIACGLMQLDPPDVMRGEETQILGFLRDCADFDGVILLPGTHSKWVRVAGGSVRQFRTVMTGEMFSVLSQHSVLRHSLGAWDDAEFLRGVEAFAARPEALIAELFQIRAGDLLRGDSAGSARLSGALIGAELGAMREFWQGQRLVVIGAGGLTRLYTKAIDSLGGSCEVMDGEAASLAGLQVIYDKIKGQGL